MKNERTTAESGCPSRLHKRMGDIVVQTGRILRLFIATLAATVAFVYVLLTRINNEVISWDRLIQTDIFWPTLILALSLAIGLHARNRFTAHQDSTTAASPVSELAEPEQKPEHRPEDDITRQMLHLTHSAERLDSVERDLIRQLSHNFTVDMPTHKLLTEMRVCSNRLRGQLSYLREIDLADTTASDRSDHEQVKIKSGFEPPDLGLPRYETPRHRRRSVQNQP